MAMATVHVLNPGPKSRPKQKTTPKRKAKSVAKKKVAKKRVRTTGTAYAAKKKAAPRRRRRKRTANPSRRRRAASAVGKALTIAGATKNLMPRLAGKLFVAWVLQQWAKRAGTGSLLPWAGEQNSRFRGQSLTLQQYAIGYFALMFAAKYLRKSKGGLFAQAFFTGGFDALATKLLWTEMVARVPWAQAQFGQTPGQAVQLDSAGNTWMWEGDQWNSMQGAELVDSGPLDGLETASALDGYGVLETASALDGNRETQLARRQSVLQTNPYQSAYV